jgi:ubiquinone/menaquinone biosynthesis C-methylase UbiE
MTTARFDSDTRALKQREQCNVEGQLHDLENWIAQQIHLAHGMRILDLGCGRGKQMFAFANLVSPEGFILGLDISDEAVNEVNQRAEKEQLDQIKAMKGSLDMCIHQLEDFRFDLILSTYAIYYSSDMKRVLSELRSLLNPKGRLFVSGPGRGTNQELINLINSVSAGSTRRSESIDDFIQEPTIREIAKEYSAFNIVRLSNQIRFDSIDRLLQWWKNHNSFMPEIYDTVYQALRSHFVQNDHFILTKNVLGIHYYA